MSAIRKHINEIQVIYFIGIGGIGMSAIARYFLSLGKTVWGYDKTATPITEQLEEEGAHIHYVDDTNLIAKDADYVVYTPAIPKDHKELEYYINNNYPVVKRSDILQLISEDSFNICIAGTHGKTTTSTMIAHLLRHSGYGCNAFLGGISANYETNFWSSDNSVCVIEADEFDRSFLKLSPDVAVVTSMDADHLDIYETEENVKDAFIQFASKTKEDGLLLKKWGLDDALQADQTITYSMQNSAADVHVEDMMAAEGGYTFNAILPDELIKEVRLNMGGTHNVENMMAAIGVAHHLGIAPQKIKDAVVTFKGVKRRFEYIVNQPDLVFIDDYAHHPAELKALINSVKTLFPHKKCTLIFQPHLFTRTRDFATEFAEVLGGVDCVILLPIYPARELSIPGVTSNMLLQNMQLREKAAYSKEELLQWVEKDFCINRNKTTGEVLITAGAGDIDKLVQPIKQILIK